MVLACESIFSRTSLDGRPQNFHTFSKVNLKYTKCSFTVGQARCSFYLPHSYNLQIPLARGNGASTNVEPWMHDILIQCHGNYMEMKNFNYMLAIDISRNFSQNIWVSLGVLLKGLGGQKDTQTPCWLRPWAEWFDWQLYSWFMLYRQLVCALIGDLGKQPLWDWPLWLGFLQI